MRFGVGGGSRVARGGVSVGKGGLRGGVGVGPFSLSGGSSGGGGGISGLVVGFLALGAFSLLILIGIGVLVLAAIGVGIIAVSNATWCCFVVRFGPTRVQAKSRLRFVVELLVRLGVAVLVILVVWRIAGWAGNYEVSRRNPIRRDRFGYLIKEGDGFWERNGEPDFTYAIARVTHLGVQAAYWHALLLVSFLSLSLFKVRAFEPLSTTLGFRATWTEEQPSTTPKKGRDRGLNCAKPWTLFPPKATNGGRTGMTIIYLLFPLVLLIRRAAFLASTQTDPQPHNEGPRRSQSE